MTLGGVAVALFAACEPRIGSPPEIPIDGPGDSRPDACGGFGGLGIANIDGTQPVGDQPSNAWAFYEPGDTGWGWQLSTNPAVLQIMMSSNQSLTCATVGAVSESEVFAYVLAAVPATGGTVAPGSYPLSPQTSEPATASSAMEYLFCSGGTGNSCGLLQAQSGTLVLDSLGPTVTGTFSASFDDLDNDSGSFCATMCPVN